MQVEQVDLCCFLQVLDKYGDIYGRERIAELLGVDLASLDVSQQHEKKQEEPDNSVFAWYGECYLHLWRRPSV